MVLSVNASGLRKLGTQLRRTQPAVYRNLRGALLHAGDEIAADAARRSSWSSRIPGSIKVRMTGVNTVVVSAGGSAAPDAKPYEHAGATGTFRHPVFADATKTRDEWTWVTQQARPFLHPAAIARLNITVEEINAAVVAAVDETLDRPAL